MNQTKMAVRCAVVICPNSYGKTRSKNPDLKYFQFPKNQDIREKWIEVCQLDPVSESNQSSYICSKHFLSSDFERDLKAELLRLPPKKILKPEAIPSLLLTKEQVREDEISQRKEKFEEFLQEYDDINSEPDESIFNLLVSDFGAPKIFVSVLDQKPFTEDQVEDSLSSFESLNHESEGNVINLRELCRLCGAYSDCLKSIVGNSDLDYYALIREYIPTIRIDENDLLPSSMCSRCENSLVSWYRFLTMCDSVNQRFQLLQNGLKENKIENLKQEIEIINNNDESSSCMEVIKEEVDEPKVELLASDSYNVFVPTNDFSEQIIEKLKPARKKRKRVFDTPVECEICQKSFRCSYTRKIHMRTVHTTERPYFCVVCNSSFKRKDHLQSHIAQVHDRSTRPTQRNAKKPVPSSFLCAECGKIFASKTSYREHIDSVHNDIKRYHCAQCDLWFNRYSKYYHHKAVLKHAKNEFLKACDYCGLEFQSEIYYTRHMTKHEQVVECEKCVLEFASHEEFKEHVSKAHVTSGEYPCDVCSRKFTSKTSLFHHKKSHSDNEKPFKCEYCNWRFRNRGHLSVHLYRHTGERPYVCSICNRGFKQKGDMRKHKAGHLLNDKKPSLSEIEVTVENIA